MKTLPIIDLLTYIYPDLYPLHLDFDYENQEWPQSLQLSFANIERHGAYLLDAHDMLILYVCKAISQEFIRDVFGVDHFSQIPDYNDSNSLDKSVSSNFANTKPGQSLRIPKPSNVISIENYDTPTSNRVNALIYYLLSTRPLKPHFAVIK